MEKSLVTFQVWSDSFRLRSLRCLPSLFSGRLPFLPSYPLRWIPSQQQLPSLRLLPSR